MPNFGPIHKLIVRSADEPYGPLGTSEFADYEIVHPDECKYEHDQHKCGVGYYEYEGGVRWSLHYAGTPVTTPGEYQIQAWAEMYRGFEYTEYDGGIALVTDGVD